MLAINWVRQQFKGISGLTYLDNAATTQVPDAVLQAWVQHYEGGHANVHRSLHAAAHGTTQKIESVRVQLQRFLHAPAKESLIFTSGTTASLNLVAQSYGGMHVQAGDHVLISVLAHHSSYLPWQQVCDKKGAHLDMVGLTDTGSLDLSQYQTLLQQRPKVVVLPYASNVLGSCVPLRKMIAQAHAVGAIVVVDAAQAVAHRSIDVAALNCDFLAFSSHKMYGPTGVGVLYGKPDLLKKMQPWQVGGGMVKTVGAKMEWEVLPYKFEAGTLPIGSILGLGAAIDFIQQIGYAAIQQHEEKLYVYLVKQLKNLPSLRFLPAQGANVGIASFTIAGLHPTDIGLWLDANDIAVRTGDHCAQPLMQHLNHMQGVVRVSLGIYNTQTEVDKLVGALHRLIDKQK